MDEYEAMWVQRVRESAQEFRADPRYPGLVETAAHRGFAPAPVALLLRSVLDPGAWNQRLYTWAGGLWVKADDEEALAYEGDDK